MFQSYSQQQARRVIFSGIKAGGAWLGYLGIFAGLLSLPPQMHEKPSARARGPDSPMKHSERSESAREAPFPNLPLFYDDPRCSWPSGDVMPFNPPAMKHPVLLYGPQLRHTPEAIAVRVSGLIIAECTITCGGEVSNCRIINGLSEMNWAVKVMLESRRYVPVQYEGRPINVEYVFKIQVAPP
jgi:hypothetical protein